MLRFMRGRWFVGAMAAAAAWYLLGRRAPRRGFGRRVASVDMNAAGRVGREALRTAARAGMSLVDAGVRAVARAR